MVRQSPSSSSCHGRGGCIEKKTQLQASQVKLSHALLTYPSGGCMTPLHVRIASYCTDFQKKICSMFMHSLLSPHQRYQSSSWQVIVFFCAIQGPLQWASPFITSVVPFRFHSVWYPFIELSAAVLYLRSQPAVSHTKKCSSVCIWSLTYMFCLLSLLIAKQGGLHLFYRQECSALTLSTCGIEAKKNSNQIRLSALPFASGGGAAFTRHVLHMRYYWQADFKKGERNEHSHWVVSVSCISLSPTQTSRYIRGGGRCILSPRRYGQNYGTVCFFLRHHRFLHQCAV